MNSYIKYQVASATTYNKTQQLVFVFDEVIKALYQTQKSINGNDIEGKHRYLNKAVDAFYVLQRSLNARSRDGIVSCFSKFNILSIRKLQSIGISDSGKQELDKVIKAVRSIRNALEESIGTLM
jgi:flagellar biosynthetic protein FliS